MASTEEVKVENVEDVVQGLDDEPAPDPDITLISSDGVRFTLPQNAALMSLLVKSMIDSQDSQEKGVDLPLPNVNAETLKKVIEFLMYHNKHPYVKITKPIMSTNMVDICKDPWDAEYINLTQGEMFDIIMAANYMDIKSLLDVSCAKIASAIKGKNTEQIRNTFNITNDFTPEEEATVRNENKWAEDA